MLHVIDGELAVLGVHEVQELVVEAQAQLFLGPAQHLFEAVAHVEEGVAGLGGAAVVAAGKAADDRLVEQAFSLDLLLAAHELGHVLAHADDGQATVLGPDHLAAVDGPKPGAVLARHAVGRLVDLALVEAVAQVGGYLRQIVGVDGVSYQAADACHQVVQVIVAQHVDHGLVGVEEGEARLAVAADGARAGVVRGDARDDVVDVESGKARRVHGVPRVGKRGTGGVVRAVRGRGVTRRTCSRSGRSPWCGRGPSRRP